MDFIYFADVFAKTLPDLPEHCVFESELTSLLAHQEVPSFILLGETNADKAWQLCQQVRQRADWALLPIFSCVSLTPSLTEATDGLVASIKEARTLAANINQSAQTLPPATLDDVDSALLRFLYTRQPRNLVPLQDWQSPDLFRYPIAELFHPPLQLLPWLNDLENRKLLNGKSLIDRVRLCPLCDTGHLNYVDTCVNCHSINIEQKDFYHCFTCGYVGMQTEFIQGQQVSCPRCHTLLRHIGTDYDRPMEDYHCQDCGQNFLEPVVIAECLQCRAKNQPESLTVASIYEYELSQLAKINVMNNTVVDVYAVLDHLNFIVPQYFEYWLSWYLQMATRYPTYRFALMLVRIDKIDELTQHLGFGFTHKLVEGIAERLRELLRNTDLTTRTSAQLLWLLLPETLADGCEILVERLQAISAATKQSDGSQILFNIGYLLSTELDLTKEQAKGLMFKLEGKSST